MKQYSYIPTIFLLFFFSFAQQTIAQQASSEITQSPLEAYVAAPDDAYNYKLRKTQKGEGFTTYIIYMQSQRWLTTNEVKDPLWWHWLTVVVPDEVKSTMGLLIIGGGSRNQKIPKKENQVLAQIAMNSGTIVAELHNIPNQAMEFVGDDFGPRKEDELIAYGWRKFIDSKATAEDAKWLARLPMTKASVRALDTMTAFCKSKLGKTVDRFTVMGASKRGWTTWTTAIVDKRVVAIAPIVIDMLNVVPSFNHHWQVYGFWAPAVGDYEREGIMDEQQSENYQRLMEITEPYSYIDQLTLPKFMINATGDQFFIPDSWQFYWNDLQGEKHIRYVANTDHSMRKSDALESFLAFYYAIAHDQPRPDFDWKVENGTIHITTNPDFQPQEIALWKARNEDARDFRMETIGPNWEKQTIEINKAGKYELKIEQPEKGWSAFYAELTFSSEGPTPFKFTTGVVVTPDTLPFPPYQQD